MIKPGLGHRIRKAREAKGFSPSQLGKLLGLTVHSIHHFESGRRRPKGSVLILLADTLTTTELFLLTGRRKFESKRRHDDIDETYLLIRSLISDKRQLKKFHALLRRQVGSLVRFG